MKLRRHFRRKKQRALCMVLAAGMMLNLAACGSTAAETEEESSTASALITTSSDIGYQSSYLELEMDLDYYDSVTVQEDEVWLRGTWYDSDNDVTYNMVIIMDTEGNVTSSTSIANTDTRSVLDIAVGDEYLVAGIYEYTGDADDLTSSAGGMGGGMGGMSGGGGASMGGGGGGGMDMGGGGGGASMGGGSSGGGGGMDMGGSMMGGGMDIGSMMGGMDMSGLEDIISEIFGEEEEETEEGEEGEESSEDGEEAAEEDQSAEAEEPSEDAETSADTAEESAAEGETAETAEGSAAGEEAGESAMPDMGSMPDLASGDFAMPDMSGDASESGDETATEQDDSEEGSAASAAESDASSDDASAEDGTAEDWSGEMSEGMENMEGMEGMEGMTGMEGMEDALSGITEEDAEALQDAISDALEDSGFSMDDFASMFGGGFGSMEEAEEEEDDDEVEWDYGDDDEDEDAGYIYKLSIYSLEGWLMQEIEIELEEDTSWFYIYDLLQDEEGNIYFYCDSSVYVYDSSLSSLFTIELENSVQALYLSSDGEVLCLYRDDENNDVIASVNLETQALDDGVTIETGNNNWNTFYLGQDGNLYAYDSDGVYQIDLTTGTYSTLFYWLDWDIDGSSVNTIASLSDNNFLLFGYSTVDRSPEITYMETVDADTLPDKIQLTLGYTRLDNNTYNVILDFNKKNETYHINVVDYSESEDSSGMSYSQLSTDILNGDCPDILILDGMATDTYIARGVLVDLYTLMEGSDLEKEDFVQSYLTATEQDGSLYTIAATFTVSTLVASSDVVGDEQSWTVEEFLEIIENLDEDSLILDNTTRDSILSTMLSLTYDTFVDRATGECYFDSEEFIALLEACMLFPEDQSYYNEYHTDNNTDFFTNTLSYYEMLYEELTDGSMLLTTLEFWNATTLKAGSGSCLTEDLTLIGYPGASGNGAILTPGTEYAISANSEYQEGAWEFLCTLIEYNGENSWSGASVVQELLDEALSDMTVQDGYYDDDGEFVAYDSTLALTEEQAQWITDLIDGATSSYYYDETVQEIVTEEAQAYFEGQKDVETVADLIQDRVEVYLAEQQ